MPAAGHPHAISITSSTFAQAAEQGEDSIGPLAGLAAGRPATIGCPAVPRANSCAIIPLHSHLAQARAAAVAADRPLGQLPAIWREALARLFGPVVVTVDLHAPRAPVAKGEQVALAAETDRPFLAAAIGRADRAVKIVLDFQVVATDRVALVKVNGPEGPAEKTALVDRVRATVRDVLETETVPDAQVMATDRAALAVVIDQVDLGMEIVLVVLETAIDRAVLEIVRTVLAIGRTTDPIAFPIVIAGMVGATTIATTCGTIGTITGTFTITGTTVRGGTVTTFVGLTTTTSTIGVGLHGRR